MGVAANDGRVNIVVDEFIVSPILLFRDRWRFVWRHDFIVPSCSPFHRPACYAAGVPERRYTFTIQVHFHHYGQRGTPSQPDLRSARVYDAARICLCYGREHAEGYAAANARYDGRGCSSIRKSMGDGSRALQRCIMECRSGTQWFEGLICRRANDAEVIP